MKAPEAYTSSHPPTPSCQDSLFSEWATLRMISRRERCMGKGASLGKEAVSADSGWVGEVATRVRRVRRVTFSASCQETRSS